MNTIKLKARLVDKRHKAHSQEIEARIETEGVFIPIRTQLRGTVFEITKVHPNGMLVYWESKITKKT